MGQLSEHLNVESSPYSLHAKYAVRAPLLQARGHTPLTSLSGEGGNPGTSEGTLSNPLWQAKL